MIPNVREFFKQKNLGSLVYFFFAPMHLIIEQFKVAFSVDLGFCKEKKNTCCYLILHVCDVVKKKEKKK
jgi:hypothetical protein